MELSNDAKAALKRIKKNRFDRIPSDDVIGQLLRAEYVCRNYVTNNIGVSEEDPDKPFAITEDGKAYLESQRRAVWRYVIASILVPLTVGAFSGIVTVIISALLLGSL